MSDRMPPLSEEPEGHLPSHLRARVLADVAPTRNAPLHVWNRRVVLGLSLCLVWITLTTLFFRVRVDWLELPAYYTLGTVLASGLIASVLTYTSGLRGKGMLGLPGGWLLGLSLTGIALIVVWSMVVIADGPSTLLVSVSSARFAYRTFVCDVLAIVFALPFFFTLLYCKHQLVLPSPARTGACIGAAAGAWGYMMIHVHCSVGDRWHALLGHAAPVTVMALWGAWLGRKVF